MNPSPSPTSGLIFFLIFFVGLPLALSYSLPLSRGQDIMTAIMERLGAFTERVVKLPLYALPLVMLGLLTIILTLVMLSPFIVIYYLRGRHESNPR